MPLTDTAFCSAVTLCPASLIKNISKIGKSIENLLNNYSDMYEKLDRTLWIYGDEIIGFCSIEEKTVYRSPLYPAYD